MGTIIPQMGALATQNPSGEADAAVGERVRFLATRKGAGIISSFVNLGIFADNAPNQQQARFIDELDGENELFVGALGYLFNGSTLDRFRGDTNGLQIMGPAASDAPELGNPVAIGGSVDNTSPAAAAEGNVRRIRVAPTGQMLVAGAAVVNDTGSGSGTGFPDQAGVNRPIAAVVYGVAPDANSDRIRTLGDVSQDGLGQLCVATAVPGAGVVTMVRVQVNNGSARTNAVTPAAGNRIRVVSVNVNFFSTTALNMEIYFGTGANIDVTGAKAVAEAAMVQANPNFYAPWPDGAGPVGLVDDVLSVRASGVVAADLTFYITYREE